MRMPSIGELNRRIQLRTRLDIPTNESDVEPTFPTNRDRWAKIEPVGTAVYAASVQIDRKVTHRVYLRYLDGIDDSYEVVHGLRIYAVRRVTDLNDARRFTVLEVEEIEHG